MDLAQIGALVAALAGIGGLIRQVWRVLRAMHQLIELIQGRPARFDGDPDARPGLARHLVQLDERLERGDRRFDQLDEALGKIEVELHPNHGSSLRDAVDRVAEATGAGQP